MEFGGKKKRKLAQMKRKKTMEIAWDHEDNGDQWDHVVIDAESKAVISMVCGKRTKENTNELIKDFASRCNDGKPPELFTTDDYWCYEDAFLNVYGGVIPERTGKPGRPRNGYQTEPDMQLR